MAEAYNRDYVFNNSGQYLNKDYSVGAKAREEMEKAELQKAEEATKTGTFGMLVAEKVKEAGVGERVIKQVADTAANTLLSITRPLGDYLDKYEDVFNGRIKEEFNGDAYQLYSASKFMAQAVAESSPILGLGNRTDEEGNPIPNLVAQKFVMDM